MHKFFVYNKFIIGLYMFRALCAHNQEVKILLYRIWYHYVEFYSKNKFDKLVHLVGFVIRMQ